MPRLFWLLLAVVSLIASLLCVRSMALRVRQHNIDHPPLIYAFLPVQARQFRFAERDTSLTDDLSRPEAPQLVVSYGNQTFSVPVTIPPRYELPGLIQHEDWLRVLFFAPLSGRSMDEFKAGVTNGDIQTRLAIVTRTPPPGFDPQTWGAVRKKDWTFDFWELRADGGVEHQLLKYPSTRGVKEPKPGELHENTWEFQAALLLMPNAGNAGPTHNFYGDALSAVGWLLPVAAFCGLLATIAAAFACAPRGRRARSWRSPSETPLT